MSEIVKQRNFAVEKQRLGDIFTKTITNILKNCKRSSKNWRIFIVNVCNSFSESVPASKQGGMLSLVRTDLTVDCKIRFNKIAFHL